MKRVESFVEKMSEAIARKTARMGEQVLLNCAVLDRSDGMQLAAPSLWSPNGSCNLLRAKDGWIAANLPRDEDLQSVAALLEIEEESAPWDTLAAHAPKRSCAELLARAEMLGLAVAGVNETPQPSSPCAIEVIGSQQKRAPRALRVIDLSSLWAGPLCGSVLAAMGADVTKVESAARPDPTPRTAPLLDQRLNGQKRRASAQFSSRDGLEFLLAEIGQCDVLITSARARALVALGLSRERLFTVNPALVWVAITGHGWRSNRIAFGDDAAAAGGLLNWENDAPHFIGDALADPLTGLAAAACALDALEHGGGAFIDVALASTAAYVALDARPPR